MQGRAFALFDTVIGRCGVAWGEAGLIGMQLPEASPGAAWARVRKRFPDAVESLPTPEIERVMERVRDLLAGGRDDLTDIALDEAEVPDFNRRVYAIARAIGPGETSTYGEVAKAMGEPGAARAVGKALARTLGRSWCHAIGCWPHQAAWAASRRTAGPTPRPSC